MKKRLRIAMLSANFPPYFGGIGNTCYHNALELARLGHDVTVFTRKYNEDFAYPKVIKVVQLKPIFKFGNAVCLPELLFIKDFDIIHVHFPFHFGAEFALIVSKLRGIPLVVSYQMDLVGRSWLKYFFKVHKKALVKLFLQNASKIIVSSRDYAENSDFRKLFSKRKKDIVAIPNGVDIQRFSPKVKSSGLRQLLKLRKDNKVVLFVGALDKAHYFKGLDFLLEAFSKVPGKNARLVVVGDGNLRQKYIDKSGWLEIADRVFFTGRVSDEELPRYYSLCDFLVLPSIDKGEAFGIVLVEAMASGKAVIASNLPGVRSVVDDGKNGLLFKARNQNDLVEKMNLLLKNQGKRLRFGKNSRKKAEREFDWKKIAKKIETVYSAVVGK